MLCNLIILIRIRRHLAKSFFQARRATDEETLRDVFKTDTPGDMEGQILKIVENILVELMLAAA